MGLRLPTVVAFVGRPAYQSRGAAWARTPVATICAILDSMRKLLVGSIAALLSMALPAMAQAVTEIGCGERGSLHVSIKPKDCFLGWPNLTLAAATGLRGIRWTSWGGSRASGRAYVQYKTYDKRQPVRVLAMGRRHCDSVFYLYTRVRVNFLNGFFRTYRTPGCTEYGDG